MVVMFADSLGKSGNPISERNKFLAFTIQSSVVLLAAFTFLLTSILGVYSGAIALRGASDAIFSLVRHHLYICEVMLCVQDVGQLALETVSLPVTHHMLLRNTACGHRVFVFHWSTCPGGGSAVWR